MPADTGEMRLLCLHRPRGLKPAATGLLTFPVQRKAIYQLPIRREHRTTGELGLQQLSSIINGPGTPPRTAVVAAHPDDEIIGAGAKLPRFKDALFIHVTDGAPEDMADAMTAGFKTREEYAEERLKELAEALALVGCEPVRHVRLDYPDQAVSFSIPKLVHGLVNLFSRLQPEIVMTHPYEGGHPDHDTTALGVHVAWEMLQRRGFEPPNIIEFTSYHGRNDQIVTFEFLSPPSTSGRGGQRRRLLPADDSLRLNNHRGTQKPLEARHQFPSGKRGGRRPGCLTWTKMEQRSWLARRVAGTTIDHNEIVTVELTQAERELKHRMMACFRTQQKVLAAFRVEIERYRFAPLYDFSVPPHPGKLYYEHFPWGMTGDKWRRLAAEALRYFNLRDPI